MNMVGFCPLSLWWPLYEQAGLLHVYGQCGHLCGQVGSYLDIWAPFLKMNLCIHGRLIGISKSLVLHEH